MQLFLSSGLYSYFRTLHALHCMLAMTMVSAIDPMSEVLPAYRAAIADLHELVPAGVRMLRFDVIGRIHSAVE
jgi:hypothetical protein